MKTNSAFFSFIFMMVVAILLFSCSKHNDTVNQPDFPQLIGTWQGTTSQNQSIRIGILSIGSILIVNTYKYNVIKYDTGSSSRTMAYEVNLSTIVTSVVNKYFEFRPYGGYSYNDYLKGTFDVTAMTLQGRFNTSFPNLAGTATDSVVGSFTAYKVK